MKKMSQRAAIPPTLTRTPAVVCIRGPWPHPRDPCFSDSMTPFHGSLSECSSDLSAVTSCFKGRVGSFCQTAQLPTGLCSEWPGHTFLPSPLFPGSKPCPVLTIHQVQWVPLMCSSNLQMTFPLYVGPTSKAKLDLLKSWLRSCWPCSFSVPNSQVASISG